MPVMRTYQCPDCEGIFEHLHMRSTEEPPAFCPLCGANTSDVAPELPAPRIAKSIGKVADDVYRQMETSSAARAEMAAEALGESASDMGAMRVTNLSDNARAGEISAPTVNNSVSQFMNQTRIGGMTDTNAGASYAAAAATGPFARAGDKMRDNVVSRHASMVPRVVAAGRVD